MAADTPDTKTSLLKGILVNIGGASGYGTAPDVAPQIIQAIVQVYGVPTLNLADTQQQLLIQWILALGISYNAAVMTEVEALKILYVYYGGANDATLPDHEIPLLRGILDMVIPPSSDWILTTNFWADTGIWVDSAHWQD